MEHWKKRWVMDSGSWQKEQVGSPDQCLFSKLSLVRIAPFSTNQQQQQQQQQHSLFSQASWGRLQLTSKRF